MRRFLLALAICAGIIGGFAGTHNLKFQAASAQQAGCQLTGYTLKNGALRTPTYTCTAPSPAPTKCAMVSYSVSGSNVISNYSCVTSGMGLPSGAVGVATPFPQASVATGTSANAYQTLSTNTITLPNSSGATGKWFGVVTEDLEIPAASAQATAALYGCLISASTIVQLGGTFQSGTTVCNGSPTNAIAGAQLFGEAPTSYAAATAGFLGLSSHIEWMGTAASGASLTFTCEVASSGTASVVVYGDCPSYWVQI